MRKVAGKLIFSPSDLITYSSSPFASWMDRYRLEKPGELNPDEDDESLKLVAQTGIDHEQAVLGELKASTKELKVIETQDWGKAHAETLAAFRAKAPIVYQAALGDGQFAGLADFVILDEAQKYQIWDTKLARSPKPYYALQLCCYSEMFAACTGELMPKHFGIILGNKDKVTFAVEDFIHYYRRIRDQFLRLQADFTGNMQDRPEPTANGSHGRWSSHAEDYFKKTDHLVQVAGISIGQIKKLEQAGVKTMANLAAWSGNAVKKLSPETLSKLVAQARLQKQTLADRQRDPDALARFEIIEQREGEEPTGLAALPSAHPADVYFDMEGYPLASGGLEYLFGACIHASTGEGIEFLDWWGHDRLEEKAAFEGFIDWVFDRWRNNLGMHIYHYAAYEVNAARRLSTMHNTRQDEVDELLRREVFVDLYQIVRQGLRVGEESYSIKAIEHLYREKRSTEVATAADSIVQYARWLESGEPRAWAKSPILKAIRDYNEDDCRSTVGLAAWLRETATRHGLRSSTSSIALASAQPYEPKELKPDVVARIEIEKQLAKRNEPISTIFSQVVDFHRREQKPMWWRLFDRAKASDEELRDDPACIAGISMVGSPEPEKQSFVQNYVFDAAQECKLAAGGHVMFTDDLETKFTLAELDAIAGELRLKVGKKTLNDKLDGHFPSYGSLLPDEFVSPKAIQDALAEIGQRQLSGNAPASATALVTRARPASVLQGDRENTIDAAIRVTSLMRGGCLVVQGPPGTGKTYTAAAVINALLDAGKKVGIASNSHKAVVNLMAACGDALRKARKTLKGIKVGGDPEEQIFADNAGLRHITDNGKALQAYAGGVVGGTAWLFTRPEWEEQLDFLFIDEAGQVALANTIAMSRCAHNLVLLGDQMQLEQPIQGAHPGDSGLSGLQFALKDLEASKEDAPVFHAVVPRDYGLFLGESRRMHPAICQFISESIYEGRLGSYPDCARQRIEVPSGRARYVSKEHGIVLCPVEHDGNVQQSDEEVARVVDVYKELLGRSYTASNGKTAPLTLESFLFISPYNAQVRALQAALPAGARVGSVDKFQGQEAPVCILSLCSSFGEYGSRGLGFILDRNRINVAISRAQCLAVVVADPRITTTPVSSLADMKLVNLFCKLATQ